jgi:hypothetical protein
MSKKVIHPPKPAAKKPQAPGADSPILQNVSPEQRKYLDSYSPMLGKVLQKLWQKFGKGPFNLPDAARLEDQIVADCDRYLTTKFKGVLNLQEYVMVLGALAGMKSGMAAAQGQNMTTENFHGAGQLFEASMRIMSESMKREIQKNRIAAAKQAPKVKH